MTRLEMQQTCEHVWTPEAARCPKCGIAGNLVSSRVAEKLAGALRYERSVSTNAGVSVRLSYEEADAIVERMKPQNDQWKDAVMDAAIVNWCYEAEHETDPKQALHAIVMTEISIAMEPLVSKDACALRDTYLPRVKELEEEIARLKADSREKVHRAFKVKLTEATCQCPYCTGNADLLAEMVANYEMDKFALEQRVAELEAALEEKPLPA